MTCQENIWIGRILSKLTHANAVVQLIGNWEFLIATGVTLPYKRIVVSRDVGDIRVRPVAEFWIAIARLSIRWS